MYNSHLRSEDQTINSLKPAKLQQELKQAAVEDQWYVS